LTRVSTLSSILAAFGSLLLTSGLVYHNYWQHPELRILDISIEPIDVNGQNVAKTEYKKPGYRKDPKNPDKYIPFEQICPKMEQGFMMVECVSNSSKIRILTDVCNVGINETTIHEYIGELLKPTKRIVGIYSCTETLQHQKKVTLGFDYPDNSLLRDGHWVFRITVKASTERKLRELEVVTENDCKTIKWRQLDC
jgi:hypothetical protein